MARKAKTVIGERDLAQSQVMLRAGEQGIAAEQRATSSISQERGAQQTRGIEAGKAMSTAYSQDRAARQTEEGQGLQRDIATGREIQEEKSRKATLAAQGLEEAPGAGVTPLMARYQESLQEDVDRGRQAEERLGEKGGGRPEDRPEGAPAGREEEIAAQRERQPGQEPEATQQATSAGAMGPPAPPQQGPPSPPRMDQAAQQAEQPMETVRPGDIRPTQAAREAQRYQRRGAAQERQISQAKMAIDKRNADANFRNAEASYMDAQTKAGDARLKQEESAKEEMKVGLAQTRQWITDLTNREIEPHRVAMMFMDNPNIAQAMEGGGAGAEGGSSPELQTALARLLNNRLATQNIRWAAVTGEALPDYGTGDLYQRFNMRQLEMTAAFRSNSVLTATEGQDPTLSDPFRQAARYQGAGKGGEQRDLYGGIEAGVEKQRQQQGLTRSWAGIRSFEEKEKFIRRATARAMMMADATSREARAQLGATGMADENAQLRGELARIKQAFADQAALFGYGVAPGGAGSTTTEIGGARVPTEHAERYQRNIERAEAGEPTRPWGEPDKKPGDRIRTGGGSSK